MYVPMLRAAKSDYFHYWLTLPEKCQIKGGQIEIPRFVRLNVKRHSDIQIHTLHVCQNAATLIKHQKFLQINVC